MTARDRQTCLICWEAFPSAAKICERCRRPTCHPCLRTFLNSRLKMGQVGEGSLTCPNFECQAPFAMSELQRYLDAQVCENLARLRHVDKVNRDPRRCWCPNPSCGAAVSLPPRMLPPKMRRNASCKECNETFCCRCGAKPHNGPCTRDVSYVTWLEGMPGNRERGGVQECPRCYHHIEKRGGCQHMRCGSCGAEWCWLCRLPWRHHNIAACRTIRSLKQKACTGSPAKRALTLSVALPIGVCVGTVFIALGSMAGVGWLAGVATYTVVVVPGKRAKNGIRRRWRERQEAVATSRARRHEDVPEDTIGSSVRCATRPPQVA